jgi:hypoxanthine phosphoribosyltransferase
MGCGALVCSASVAGLPIMRTLLTAEQLAAGIARLAAEVRADVAREPLTVVGVLTGSIMLAADLLRHLDIPTRVGMVWASSYRGTATRPGPLDLRLDSLPEIGGHDVLVVDDIFDSGRTLDALVAELRLRGAARVRSLVLLRKTGRAEVALVPDFVGFDIPNEFVVGYGLDFDGGFRHLPYVAALDPEDLAHHAGHAATSR